MDAGNFVGMDVMLLTEIGSSGKDELHEKYGNIETFDDVTNQPLLPKLVMAARAEELKYFDEMGVYEYATLEECHRATGKVPIGKR